MNHDSKQAKLVRTDVGWITTPRYVQYRYIQLVQTRVSLTLTVDQGFYVCVLHNRWRPLTSLDAFRDIDPIQTWRIREIKGLPRRALYGSA